MNERKYWVTVAEHPLKRYDQETDRPISRNWCKALEAAVDGFVRECKALDTGCVQLWDGESELGCLYL